MSNKESYPYKKQSILQQISQLRSRISIMEWDSVTGVTPTWYAYQEIDLMEKEICDLQEQLHDEMMPETRKVG